MQRVAALSALLGACDSLRVFGPMRPTAPRAGFLAMAIGDVPPGFLGAPPRSTPRRHSSHCATPRRPATPRAGEDQLGDWVQLKKSNALGASVSVGLPAKALALLNRVQTDSKSIEFADVMCGVGVAEAVGVLEGAAGVGCNSTNCVQTDSKSIGFADGMSK